MSKPHSAARGRSAGLGALALVLLAAVGTFAGGATARSSESPKNIAAPTVSDTQGAPLTSVKVGDTIQGNNGSWYCSPPYPGMTGCKIDFQWQRCNAGGGDCRDIPGQTSQRRVVTAEDAGSRLRVMVTGTNYDCNQLGTECRFDSRSVPSGQSPVVQALLPPAPTSTAKPAISGLAEERETLTTNDGGWTGTGPITTARHWQQCDASGAGCANIAGATAPTYVVQAGDIGRRLRVFVSATNAGGSTTSTSDPTEVVRPLTPRPGRMVLGIEDVSLPNRLLIDRFTVSANPIRSLKPVLVRFRISDTRGFRITGALVRVTSVPFGQIKNVAEAESSSTGWATFKLVPTKQLELKNGGWLYLYVQARKPAERADAGVSATKLVRLRLAAPATP